MGSHRFLAGEDQDTQIIGRVSTNQDTLAEEDPPLRRRFTALAASFVGFLGATGLMAYWVVEHAGPRSDTTPAGQRFGLLALWLLSAMTFGAALFRDTHARRARVVNGLIDDLGAGLEKTFRNLLFYKADEAVQYVRSMHADTLRQVDGMIARALSDLEENRRRNMAAYAVMHRQTVEEVATLIQQQLEGVRGEHDLILHAVLMLEKVMPELLAQESWVSYAKGIRAALDGEVPGVMEHVRRLPNATPARRPNHGGLRAVPEPQSN